MTRTTETVAPGRSTALAAMVVLAVAGGAAACGSGSDAVAGNRFNALPADQVVFSLEMDIKEMGVLRARLHADTAYIWEDSGLTRMFPVDLKLYDDNGGETAHLTAREGELETRTNAMVARGNVVLVSLENDRRVLTEELHYDPQSGRIWSDVHTVFFDGGSRMEGQGFRADDRMENIEVFKATGENIPVGF
jgi:LPS export ABC transporter protein LptC